MWSHSGFRAHQGFLGSGANGAGALPPSSGQDSPKRPMTTNPRMQLSRDSWEEEETITTIHRGFAQDREVEPLWSPKSWIEAVLDSEVSMGALRQQEAAARWCQQEDVSGDKGC